MIFIDTNVWLYFANKDSPFYESVELFLRPCLKGEREFAVSWQIIYEFIRTVTHPNYHATPLSWKEAHNFVTQVLRFPNMKLIQEGPAHAEALEYVVEQSGYTRGYFIHDCHIAALLYENGIRRIMTADQDFRRFPFLEVVDPTK